jgi:hypothetical protein
MTKTETSVTGLEPRRLVLAGLALALAAMVAGLAFGGWLTHGAAILATMAESGLSWCL